MSWRALPLCLVLFSSCRDEAAEAYARAELKYRDLVAQSARPEDPRFDEVLRELEKVPASSRHYANAQKMMGGIKAVRGSKVRTPLALGPNGRRAPELEAHLAACARLAAMAGADGGMDQRVLKALDECRLNAEKLELRFSHPEEFEDGGHGHGHDGHDEAPYPDPLPAPQGEGVPR
jgi:hypothetical protein